jgi:hypothetical protein
MNKFSLFGIIIVQLALICYSIAIITEQRKKLVSAFVLSFLTIGVIFDITATAFMILGSSHGIFTLHGILGYSSLVGMFTDSVIIWRFYKTNPTGTVVTRAVHLFSRFAYIWWIAAYITGALLVALRHA